ncbi:MAG: ferredoxin [Deltaproteobacteria bacterium]|nr:ferredoxin [Deltaproteobacteria bacterium]
MWKDNVLERHLADAPVFYTNGNCIVCSVCSDIAPDNFGISDEEDHYRVRCQPRDAAELERCREAMENCPVGAIGDDGV